MCPRMRAPSLADGVVLWRPEESRQVSKTVDLSGRGQGALCMDVVVMKACSASDVTIRWGRRLVLLPALQTDGWRGG